MKPLIAGFNAAFPDTAITIHEIVGAPGRAGVRAEITATHSGEWFGVAPTGRRFSMALHEFHHVENGRLTHTWHLEDWFCWLHQVGAWPQQKGDGMMRTARIGGYEAAPTLENVTVPEIGPDDVLVRVAAAALNPLDVKLRAGVMKSFFPLQFPYTIGTDLAGTVERVGSNVTGWSEGDRVVARADPPTGGAMAEFALVPASHLARVPAEVPLETAAGLPTTGGTAWQALFEVGNLKAGQTVLIHAGAGGVGSFAIQLARAAGARVIATASGDGVATARRLGADQVIDYKAQDFATEASDVDLVLDTVGGETQQRSFAVLRSGGTLVSIVQPPDEALARAHRVTASFMAHMSDADRLAKVVKRVAIGTEVLIDRILPLNDLPDAFAHQASGRARGKVVLTN